MKKRTIYWLPILLIIIITIPVLFNQKVIHEVLANSKFDSKKAESELCRETSENVYPFSMNYKGRWGCPVVRIKLDGNYFTMLVDTGCTLNWIYNNGIIKAFGSMEEFKKNNYTNYVYEMQKQEPNFTEKYNYKKILSRMHNDLLSKKYLPYYRTNFGDSIVTIERKNPSIDGILGQAFLMRYKYVTFDFTNNLFILNNEKISGHSSPMILGEDNRVYISFLYNDMKEIGLIDTGNYTFTPRADFGINEIKYDFKMEEEYSISYDGSVPKRFPMLHKFSNIIINNESFNNIRGVYSNIWFSSYNKGAQNHLLKVNGLGCEFFRDYVIQLDYEKMEFIMQKRG